MVDVQTSEEIDAKLAQVNMGLLNFDRSLKAELLLMR
jgi:hypothetical protein